MSRPLIGVSARFRDRGEVRLWPDTQAAVMQYPYLESLWRAGGMEAMLAPRIISAEEADAVVARLDGLILVGGPDVDPARYGAEPDPHVYGVLEANDSLEIELARAGLRAGLPMLMICRGLQVLNVALGGTLHQHITGLSGLIEHGPPVGGTPSLHPVTVQPSTRLANVFGGAKVIEQCWSYHHQAIDQLGRGLMVSAHSSDGIVEAVELADGQAPWVVAVQWHPERTAHEDAMQQSLFDELVRQAGKHRTVC